MTVIDSHQHIWDPQRAEYDWMDDALGSFNRAVGFNEMQASRRRAGIDATVLVQSADNDDDTAIMLEAAGQYSRVVAVVAFAPLGDPARVRQLAERFAPNPVIVGIRNLIHNYADPTWLLRDPVRQSLDIIAGCGLTFDLVAVLPQHLELVPELVRRHPTLRVVIDHLAKPPIEQKTSEPWWSLIERAAASPTVFAKISGLYASVAPPGERTTDAIRPYYSRALDVFGANRLMFGSDWPISETAGGFDRVWDDLSALVDNLDETARRQIFGDTAKQFYRIDHARLTAADAASARIRNSH